MAIVHDSESTDVSLTIMTTVHDNESTDVSSIVTSDSESTQISSIITPNSESTQVSSIVTPDSESIQVSSIITPDSESAQVSSIVTPDSESTQVSSIITPDSESTQVSSIVTPDSESTQVSSIITPDSESTQVSSIITPDSESTQVSSIVTPDSESTQVSSIITPDSESKQVSSIITPNSESAQVSSIVTPDSESTQVSSIITPDSESTQVSSIITPDSESTQVSSIITPDSESTQVATFITPDSESAQVACTKGDVQLFHSQPVQKSRSKRFEEFSAFLQNVKEPIKNFEEFFESALLKSRINLRLDCICERLGTFGDMLGFTSSLSISGIFIARVISSGRALARNEVFKMAYTIITTRSYIEIRSLKDPGVDAMKTLLSSVEMRGGCQAVKNALTKQTKLSIREPILFTRSRLHRFCYAVKSRSKECNSLNVMVITVITQCARENQLSVRWKFSSVLQDKGDGGEDCENKMKIRCNLYVGGIWLGIGDAVIKRYARLRAYTQAWHSITEKHVVELLLAHQQRNIDLRRDSKQQTGHLFGETVGTNNPELISSRIYLCNVATRYLDKTDIERIFEPYGPIDAISISRVKKYRYAFVQYRTEEAARRAVAEDGNEYAGQIIYVNMAAERNKQECRALKRYNIAPMPQPGFPMLDPISDADLTESGEDDIAHASSIAQTRTRVKRRSVSTQAADQERVQKRHKHHHRRCKHKKDLSCEIALTSCESDPSKHQCNVDQASDVTDIHPVDPTERSGAKRKKSHQLPASYAEDAAITGESANISKDASSCLHRLTGGDSRLERLHKSHKHRHRRHHSQDKKNLSCEIDLIRCESEPSKHQPNEKQASDVTDIYPVDPAERRGSRCRKSHQLPASYAEDATIATSQSDHISDDESGLLHRLIGSDSGHEPIHKKHKNQHHHHHYYHYYSRDKQMRRVSVSVQNQSHKQENETHSRRHPSQTHSRDSSPKHRSRSRSRDSQSPDRKQYRLSSKSITQHHHHKESIDLTEEKSDVVLTPTASQPTGVQARVPDKMDGVSELGVKLINQLIDMGNVDEASLVSSLVNDVVTRDALLTQCKAAFTTNASSDVQTQYNTAELQPGYRAVSNNVLCNSFDGVFNQTVLQSGYSEDHVMVNHAGPGLGYNEAIPLSGYPVCANDLQTRGYQVIPQSGYPADVATYQYDASMQQGASFVDGLSQTSHQNQSHTYYTGYGAENESALTMINGSINSGMYVLDRMMPPTTQLGFVSSQILHPDSAYLQSTRACGTGSNNQLSEQMVPSSSQNLSDSGICSSDVRQALQNWIINNNLITPSSNTGVHGNQSGDHDNCPTVGVEIDGLSDVYSDRSDVTPRVSDHQKVFKSDVLRSNIDDLRKFFNQSSVDDLIQRSVSDLVILEDDEWSDSPFAVLKNSASRSGLLMEWRVESSEESVIYNCKIFLQKELQGSGMGTSCYEAYSKSAHVVLQNLYKTSSVVQLLLHYVTEMEYSWEEIQHEASKWTPSPGDNDLADIVKLSAPSVGGDERPALHYAREAVYICHLLNEYIADDRNKLQDCVFGPGVPIPEQDVILEYARCLGINAVQTTSSLGHCLVFFMNVLLQEVVTLLKKSVAGCIGKYCLLKSDTCDGDDDDGDMLQFKSLLTFSLNKDIDGD